MPRRNQRGYILVEAVISLGLLSVAMGLIHSSVRETLIVRGMSRDYTQARFLLEQVVAEVQLQPVFIEEEKEGRFDGEFSRFRWKWKMSKIDIPPPPPPPPPPDGRIRPPREKEFELPIPKLAKLVVSIHWTQAGRDFEETVETMYSPNRLWTPPVEGDNL
jgi:hypothetical protein